MLIVLLAALGLPAAATAQEQQLEPTIIVDAATPSATSPTFSGTTLQAGRPYLLVVNGQYTETFPTVGGGTFTYFMDGVYCSQPLRAEVRAVGRVQRDESRGGGRTDRAGQVDVAVAASSIRRWRRPAPRAPRC